LGYCPDDQCCSKDGLCGSLPEYCSDKKGCQTKYGKCVENKCGKEWGSSPDDKCCSQGCQVEYGECAKGKCGELWGSCPEG